MQKLTLILCFMLVACHSNKLTNLLTHQFEASDECEKTDSMCPLTSSTNSKASCHLDKQHENCTDGVCWRFACVYCKAKYLGCSTNFQGGVPGTIVGFERLNSYNCQYIKTVEETGFSIQCSCSGICSFNSQWRVFYKPFVPPTNEITQ